MSVSFSFFELLSKILAVLWPILGIASVVAGILFVKAVPRAYNWCFLLGSCIQVIGSLAFPLLNLMNFEADLISQYYTYVSGFNLVGGILIAYGIIGHAVSYSKMAVHFNQQGFREE